MKTLRAWWSRAFLIERPSISLSLFRLAVGITVGCHVIPSLLELPDNYLTSAFKEQNGSFFPLWTLRLVSMSPDWLVYAFVWLFLISWSCFVIGLKTQPAAMLMGVASYYFYALNALHIGTLSFDILLVTLSLIYVTNYPGDFLSVDSLIRGDAEAYNRPRPFFVQRLLQWQLAWTFWYTALSKMTAGGNWLTDNPYYYLMRYPAAGVVREFPLRELLAQHPTLCWVIGLGVIGCELALPVLWCLRRTRTIGLILGLVFHVLLLVTLHVPTIFLFLFPPQMLLWVEPERVVGWIRARQARSARGARATLLYDGRCGFCLASVKRLHALDLFRQIDTVDFHAQSSLIALHPSLTIEQCRSEMVLLEPGGRLSGGFGAFRRLVLRLPMLRVLAPFVYLPGAAWIGTRVYRWVAAHRDLFHRSAVCQGNQCALIIR